MISISTLTDIAVKEKYGQIHLFYGDCLELCVLLQTLQSFYNSVIGILIGVDRIILNLSLSPFSTFTMSIGWIRNEVILRLVGSPHITPQAFSAD